MCEMCDNGGDEEAVMAKVRALVDEYGVTYVPVVDGGFVYTVGLYQIAGAELLADARSNAPLCGDHQANAEGLHAFLQPVVELVRHVGSVSIFSRFRAEDLIGEPHHLDLAFEAADSSKIGVANRYYGRRVPVLRARRVPGLGLGAQQ